MHPVDLHGASSIEIFISNVAREETPRQKHRQKNWLLEDARNNVQNPIWPWLEEPTAVSNAIAEDGSGHTKGYQELHNFIFLFFVSAIDHVCKLGPDVGLGENSVKDQEKDHRADWGVFRL